MHNNPDEILARHLQAEYIAYENFKKQKEIKEKENLSPIDSKLEYIDPTPSIHDLFVNFDKKFFWSSLGMVEVLWSNKMTQCAGMCYFIPRGGLCKISLSAPLLSLRPRKDLVETLLHEMIHAYLFVTRNFKDRDDHGPEFHKHMNRINQQAGTNITVYHTFYDEVEYYQKHIWRCNGSCKTKRPHFGFVRRSMNRPPGPNDPWWKQHQAECGGTFIKISEPEVKSQKSKKTKETPKTDGKIKDIRDFFHKTTPATSNKIQGGKKTSNINTLSDLKNSKTVGGMKTNAGTGTIVITSSSSKKKSESLSSTKGTVKSKTKSPDLKGTFSVKVSERKESCTKDSDNVNAQETVRRVWANKFSNSKLTDNKLPIKPTLKKMKVECPICSKGFSEEEIHQHVEACLEGVKDPKAETKDLPCESSNLDKPNDMRQCPVCSKNFLLQEMENHLESCLNCSFVNKTGPDEIICDSFPCPCCYKWFRESEMGAHIDKCLTSTILKEGIVEFESNF